MKDQFQQRIIDRSLSDPLDLIAFACCHVRCSFPSRHFFTFENLSCLNLSCLYDDASSQGYIAKAPFSRGFPFPSHAMNLTRRTRFTAHPYMSWWLSSLQDPQSKQR